MDFKNVCDGFVDRSQGTKLPDHEIKSARGTRTSSSLAVAATSPARSTTAMTTCQARNQESVACPRSELQVANCSSSSLSAHGIRSNARSWHFGLTEHAQHQSVMGPATVRLSRASRGPPAGPPPARHGRRTNATKAKSRDSTCRR